MRFDLATTDFEYGGLSRPGFPLLSDDDLSPLEPFHSFLVEEFLDGGAALKPLTWEAYGRRLWDYASFLRGQGLDWRPDHGPHGKNPVLTYRDWSRSAEQSVATSTLNDRLSIVMRFYRWALRTGRISALPFKVADVRISSAGGAFEYRQAKARARGLKPAEYQRPLAFLTKSQVALVRGAYLNPTHSLMFEMAGRAGLRSSELRTFPINRVIDPTRCSWLGTSSAVKVELDPKEMEIKFDKARTIDVPYSLMQQMHKYKTSYRLGLPGSRSQQRLLLTSEGRPYSKDAVVDAFASISRAVGFRVRAHLMRHTFAVYFLLAIRQTIGYQGNPLEHLMNQLGHSSVQSVMVYLRHIGEASVAVNAAIQRQLDDIFVD